MMLPSNHIQSMDDFLALERHFKVNFLERQVSASVSLCLAPLSKPGHPATVPLESLKFGMNRGFQQTVQRSFGLNFFLKKFTKFSLWILSIDRGNVWKCRTSCQTSYIYCMVLQVHFWTSGWPKAPFFTGGWRGAGSQRGLVSWGAVFKWDISPWGWPENHRKPSAPFNHQMVYPWNQGLWWCMKLEFDRI